LSQVGGKISKKKLNQEKKTAEMVELENRKVKREVRSFVERVGQNNHRYERIGDVVLLLLMLASARVGKWIDVHTWDLSEFMSLRSKILLNRQLEIKRHEGDQYNNHIQDVRPHT
jgi:hypothetical protein